MYDFDLQLNPKMLLIKMCCICFSNEKNHIIATPGPSGYPIGYPQGTRGASRGQNKTCWNQQMLPIEVVMCASEIKKAISLLSKDPRFPMGYP